MGGLVKASALNDKDRAEGKGLTNAFGEPDSQSLNAMGKMAFEHHSVNSASKNSKVLVDKNHSVRADGVDLGLGKGDFYDHKGGQSAPTPTRATIMPGTRQKKASEVVLCPSIVPIST